mgnify:CR=1 FL=1
MKACCKAVRTLILCFAFFMLAASSIDVHAAEDNDTTITVNVDALRVRQNPSLKAKRLGRVNKGNTLRYIDTVDDEWIAVEFNGETAYVAAQYVTINCMGPAEEQSLQEQVAVLQDAETEQIVFQTGSETVGEAVAEAAATEEAPVPAETAVTEEVPVSAETAVTEEVPVPAETAVTEEVPVPAETAVTEEVPVDVETAVTEETPAVAQTLALGEITAAQELPQVIEEQDVQMLAETQQAPAEEVVGAYAGEIQVAEDDTDNSADGGSEEGIVLEEEAVPLAAEIVEDSYEVKLLAALIQCEAGGECYEGQVAVGAVVMNRVADPRFPETISEVIYQSGQFTPVKHGKVDRVLASGNIYESCLQAAREAISGVSNVGTATRFRRGTRADGIVIQHHVFYSV